jgi:hypothetical protein
MKQKTHEEEVREQGLAIINNILDKPSKVTVALIKSNIENGMGDPAYTGIVLKKFAKIAEEVKKDKTLQDIIETDTKRYNDDKGKTFMLHGAKITIANTGYTDFSTTEDEYLTRLVDIEAQVKDLIKKRKEELVAKAATWESQNSPKNIVDFGLKPFNVTWDNLPELTWIEGYGEVSTNPPIKKGHETLRYTL